MIPIPSYTIYLILPFSAVLSRVFLANYVNVFCLTSSPLTEISWVAWTRLNSPLHAFLCLVHSRSFINICIMSACLDKWRNYEILEDLSKISSYVLLIHIFPYFPYAIIEIFVSSNVSSLTSCWSSFYSWGWSTLNNLLISASKNNFGFCQSQNMYLDALFFLFIHFPNSFFCNSLTDL